MITTTGTPLRIGIETAGRIAYDGVMARYNADIIASQRERQADVFDAVAKSTKIQGRYAIGATLSLKNRKDTNGVIASVVLTNEEIKSQ